MPHSAYMLSREQLDADHGLARRYDARCTCTRRRALGRMTQYGLATTTGRCAVLDAAGVLGRGTVVAHAVQVDDADIALLADTGTAVAHCPVSNLHLGCGIAPLPELLRAASGGLGTDGAASAGPWTCSPGSGWPRCCTRG